MTETKVELISHGAPNGQGDYYWETPESVVAIPEELAQQLLRINGGTHYSVAEKYDASVKKSRTPQQNTEEKPKPKQEPPVEFVAGEVEPDNQLSTALNLVTPKGTRTKRS